VVRLQLNKLSLLSDDDLGISLRDIDLQVRGGEILGIAGVAGNGQDELLKTINGEVAVAAKQIRLDGEDAGKWSANQKRLHGLVNVPEKRLGHAAVPSMSLVENAVLTACQRLKLCRFGFLNYLQGEAYTRQIIEKYFVKTPNEFSSAESLSGGNLQKFIVGRELLQDPQVIVVSQPTWGVDAGAAQFIRASLRTLANNGCAVLVISQDLDELMEICDRIGAICAGNMSPFYPVKEMTSEKVGLMMAGAA
jgi:ABC-type uncharacterized transport system ATPase subunit